MRRAAQRRFEIASATVNAGPVPWTSLGVKRSLTDALSWSETSPDECHSTAMVPASSAVAPDGAEAALVVACAATKGATKAAALAVSLVEGSTATLAVERSAWPKCRVSGTSPSGCGGASTLVMVIEPVGGAVLLPFPPPQPRGAVALASRTEENTRRRPSTRCGVQGVRGRSCDGRDDSRKARWERLTSAAREIVI